MIRGKVNALLTDATYYNAIGQYPIPHTNGFCVLISTDIKLFFKVAWVIAHDPNALEMQFPDESIFRWQARWR